MVKYYTTFINETVLHDKYTRNIGVYIDSFDYEIERALIFYIRETIKPSDECKYPLHV